MKSFASQIIVPVCDHFFDGEKENSALLKQTYAEHPDVEFIEYAYLFDQTYSPYLDRKPSDLDWNQLWHSTSRYVGFFFLKEEIDYVLFLDVDEIVESKKFCAWLDTKKYLEFDALRFQTYYYFREAGIRALQHHNNSVLVKKSAMTPAMILNPDERFGLFAKVLGKKCENVSGLDNKPMIHHYSGVKTKQEWLKKTHSWAHHWEKDWKTLIEREFAGPFSGQDFTFGHTYETVEPYFDPLRIKPCIQETFPSSFPHVKKVNHKEIQRRELAYSFL